MNEWKKPVEEPKLPASVKEMLEALERLKLLVEGQIEKDVQSLDKAARELAKLRKKS